MKDEEKTKETQGEKDYVEFMARHGRLEKSPDYWKKLPFCPADIIPPNMVEEYQ